MTYTQPMKNFIEEIWKKKTGSKEDKENKRKNCMPTGKNQNLGTIVGPYTQPMEHFDEKILK